MTVGTDHHQFDRLIEWVDDWLGASGGAFTCLVQRGRSIAPKHTESVEYMPYPEMESMLRSAAVVVSHAGPGTIMMALSAGRTPVVVPRRADLEEHVDDHQGAFARRVASDGTIWLAETRERFVELLEASVSEPERFRSPERQLGGTAAVAELERLIEGVVLTRRTRRVLPR